MKLPFCDHHIITFLARHSPDEPLDYALSAYLRANKSIGAHDRRKIGETLFSIARWKSLLDHVCREGASLTERLTTFYRIDWARVGTDPSIPEPCRLGSTPFLFDKLCLSYGEQKARQLCLASLTPAPISIRANTLKISREELLEKWKGIFDASPSRHSSHGITLSKREPLFALPEFKEGFFEVQDEGSQLVAAKIQVKPGEHVLDYCSGSGGKTLAFAPAMGGKGQIYLHDVRPSALLQARQRLKRAGVQNAQFLLPEHPKLPQLRGKMHWVLADVPCSGSGTFRRNPEMKWKIDAPLLERLTQEQRDIFAEALRYVRPGGKIVYATCSIFPEENGKQAAFFQKEHGLVLDEEPLSIFPTEGGMDGFYAAVFRKLEN